MPKKSRKECHFEHNIQLQLFDIVGFPVENTQFWVTLTVHKEGSRITLSLPGINFEVGQFSAANPFVPLDQIPALIPFVKGGGTLRTVDGFLPECYRPSEPLSTTFVGAAGSGAGPFFYLVPNFSDLPQPVAGYNVSITFYGGIIISAAGTFNNYIPPGPQTLLPFSLFYYHKEREILSRNTVISTGPSDITQFKGFSAQNLGYRDFQINDAFDNVLVWGWADNSDVPDKTNNVLKFYIAVGEVVDNKIQIRSRTHLTDFRQAGFTSRFNHSVTINRTDKNNIVAAYLIGDLTHVPCNTGTYLRAVTSGIPEPFVSVVTVNSALPTVAT